VGQGPVKEQEPASPWDKESLLSVRSEGCGPSGKLTGFLRLCPLGCEMGEGGVGSVSGHSSNLTRPFLPFTGPWADCLGQGPVYREPLPQTGDTPSP
jgi:hypothetical protein